MLKAISRTAFPMNNNMSQRDNGAHPRFSVISSRRVCKSVTVYVRTASDDKMVFVFRRAELRKWIYMNIIWMQDITWSLHLRRQCFINFSHVSCRVHSINASRTPTMIHFTDNFHISIFHKMQKCCTWSILHNRIYFFPSISSA